MTVPTQPRAGGCGGQLTQGGVRRAVSSSAMLAACRHGWGGVDTATAASRFLWPKRATRTPANTTAASRRSPPPAPSPAHCIGSAVWLHLHHHRVLTTPNDARWVEAAQSHAQSGAIGISGPHQRENTVPSDLTSQFSPDFLTTNFTCTDGAGHSLGSCSERRKCRSGDGPRDDARAASARRTASRWTGGGSEGVLCAWSSRHALHRGGDPLAVGGMAHR